jgi:hypothetical protein
MAGEYAGMPRSENPATTPSESTGSPRRQQLVERALTLLGLALAGAGVAAVFTTDSDTGAAALLGVGVLLVLFAAVGDRLESLRYGDLELALRRKADEAAERGDARAARVLRDAADTVGERVARAARSYKAVRRMKPGRARTEKLDEIVAEGRRAAHEREIDEEEVLSVLWTGSAGARAWALGVLRERPELATTRAILEALQRPEHMHDQYHALALADQFLDLGTTEPWTRNRIGDTVRDLRESGAFGTDEACLRAADGLLDKIDKLRDPPS